MNISTKYYLWSLLLSMLLYSIGSLQAQKSAEFQIESITPNQEAKTLDIRLSVNKRGTPINIDGANIEVLEKTLGEDISKLEIINIAKDYGKHQIVFLIDAKNKTEEHLKEINIAIERIVKTYNLPESHYRIKEFGLVSELSRALKDSEQQFNGKLIAYLFTDNGGNFTTIDDENKTTTIATKVRENLLEIIENFNTQFHLFPIALSNNVDQSYLMELTEASPSLLDATKIVQPSANFLYDALDNTLSDFLVNFVLQTIPNPPVFQGESRELMVRAKKDSDIYTNRAYSFGTPSNPLDLRRRNVDIHHWINRLVIGALIISLLLALLSMLIPQLKKIAFRRKHIKLYKKVKPEGRIKRDPLTGEPFEDTEKVVVKCQHMTALSSWEYNNNQCVYYPDECTNGVVNLGADKFFSQEGLNKHLNWLWFGAFGGWIAWGLQALLNNNGLGLFNKFSAYLATMPALANSWGADDLNISIMADSLVEQLMMGVAMGIGLGFTLAWVEERGQSSKISWGSILLRTIIAAFAAFILFFIGFFLSKGMDLPPYLGGLVSWVLFGLGLGLVLSIRSNVESLRGLLGGLVAGGIAFTLYFLSSKIYPDFETLKMLSFILYGSVMGIIIVAILKRLEDFELEYLSPEKYRRINPISKWLKADMDIFIGSESGCYVFIKWNDPAVQAKHAKLNFRNNQVFIEPYAETLLNGHNLPLHQKVALKDGDIIKLGNESVTRMKFRAKSIVKAPVVSQQRQGSLPSPKITIKKKAT